MTSRYRVLLPHFTLFVFILIFCGLQFVTPWQSLYFSNIGALKLANAWSYVDTPSKDKEKMTYFANSAIIDLKSVAPSYTESVAQLLGQAYWLKGDTKLAQTTWQTSPIPSATELVIRSLQAQKIHEYDKALGWLLLAKSIRPDWNEPLYHEGLVYQDMGYITQAIDSFHLSVQMLPGNRDASYQLAQIYISQKNWLTALDALQGGLNAQGRDIGMSVLLFHIGYIYQYKLVDYDKAWTNYSRALHLDDYMGESWLHAQTYYHQGNLLAEKKDFEEAILFYRQALEENPNYYWAHLTLADALWELGHDNDATTELHIAIDQEPTIRNGYLLLIKIHLSASEVTKAETVYSEMQRYLPADREIEQLIAKNSYSQ